MVVNLFQIVIYVVTSIYEIFLGGKVKACEYFIKQKQQKSIIIQLSKRVFMSLICLIKIFMQKNY